MKVRTATIIGASGLVGSHILRLLQEDGDFDEIRLLLRRSLSPVNPKVREVIIDFNDKEALKSGMEGSDVVFCAIGTTNKKVKGDKAAYRKVDYDIPANAARFCGEVGCNKFALVSSVGANSKSKNFYLQLKGEVEDLLTNSKIKSVSVFRPSMIMGKRQEFRLAEEIAKVLMNPVSFLFPSNMKPIYASEIAKAMISASKLEKEGVNIFHYKEIKELNK